MVRPTVISNIAFLVPAIFAVWIGLMPMASLVLIVFVISTYYHYSKQTKLNFLDELMACVLMGSNLYIFSRGEMVSSVGLVTLALVVVALYFYYRQFFREYEFNHAIWHIVSGGITLGCMITYTLEIVTF